MISHLYQKENGSWVIQTNKEHCEGVAKMAASFASEFGMEHLGHVLGLMHDRGKEKTDMMQTSDLLEIQVIASQAQLCSTENIPTRCAY